MNEIVFFLKTNLLSNLHELLSNGTISKQIRSRDFEGADLDAGTPQEK